MRLVCCQFLIAHPHIHIPVPASSCPGPTPHVPPAALSPASLAALLIRPAAEAVVAPCEANSNSHTAGSPFIFLLQLPAGISEYERDSPMPPLLQDEHAAPSIPRPHPVLAAWPQAQPRS